MRSYATWGVVFVVVLFLIVVVFMAIQHGR